MRVLSFQVERVAAATNVAFELALASWAIGELACWRRRAGISVRLTMEMPVPYAPHLALKGQQRRHNLLGDRG